MARATNVVCSAPGRNARLRLARKLPRRYDAIMRELRWTVLTLLASLGCDSPQLASFNTPEPCDPRVTGILTFSAAEKQCDTDCLVCIESVTEDHVLTYSVSRQENCVCTPPLAHAPTASDAGTDGVGSSDGGIEPSDAGVYSADGGGPTPYRPADDCRSRLHLREREAHQYCEGLDDCHVCVERVDYEGDPRSYLAHQCGCPAPHRVDPK